MRGVTKAARKSNGLSRMCESCTICRRDRVCTPEVQRVCSDAFKEGFVKGSKWAEKQSKKLDNEICPEK